MKFLFVIIILLSGTVFASGQSFPAMTFNIRFDHAGDGRDNWHFRKADIIEFVKVYEPTFLGIQEGQVHQVQYLDSCLTDYKYIGAGRDDGKTAGEYSALFYDSTKVSCIKSNTFWLSETPDTPSLGWDAQFKRVCTYGLFQFVGSGKKVWVFNTHFDHIGEVARRNSAALILDKITQFTQKERYPVILMGDFNAIPMDEPIQIIRNKLDDGMDLSPLAYGPTGTFNGFVVNDIPDRRIDYLFVKGISVKSYAHMAAMTKLGGWLSDHYPVLAELNLVP